MMRVLITVSAVVSLLFVMPMAYMFFDQQPPYEYDVDGSYIIPSKTRSGHQMTVHWKLKKVNRVCAGSIVRNVVDQSTGVRISYDPTPAARTLELGDMYLDRSFYLPQLISPGMKWYYSDAEFACNPLQHFYPLRVRTPRLSFEVQE